MQICLHARRQQINEEKRKCQECLRSHSLNWGLFGNTMLPEIIVCRIISRSVNDLNVFKIHAVVVLIYVLRDLRIRIEILSMYFENVKIIDRAINYHKRLFPEA